MVIRIIYDNENFQWNSYRTPSMLVQAQRETFYPPSTEQHVASLLLFLLFISFLNILHPFF